MAKVIYKYAIERLHDNVLEMPTGAEFLHVDVQDGRAVAWFMIDTTAPLSDRGFEIIGTGQAIPQGRKYLGTYQEPPYVWHLFEVL